MLLASSAGFMPAQDAQTTYQSFANTNIPMNVWIGNNVALLTPVAKTFETTAVRRIVGALDGAYLYYATVNGREPAAGRTYQGRATVAVVDSTCGAGCGFLGFTGIELTEATFQVLYEGVRLRDEFDQPVFYEYGRNFWFAAHAVAGGTSGFRNSVATGYAVYMRFPSLRAAGVRGGPFNQLSFREFERQIASLIDRYVADPTLNFANTLAIEQGVPGSGLGATDLFASMVFRLGRDFGGEVFVTSFWRALQSQPTSTNEQEAIDQVFLAACTAARRNLTSLFVGQWRWPISAAAQATAGQYRSSAQSVNANVVFENLSTRGLVGQGDSQMIAGFVIKGTAPKRVIVRALGPSLADFGVLGALGDPVLKILDGQTVLASNDDWQSTQAAAITSTGLAPVHPRECAIVLDLAPKAYTAIVSGSGGTSGIALVEVYEL